MEVVAILAISLPGGGENPPDWQTFAGVVVLLVINATASFIVEDNAGSAAASVMANLALKTKVIRNGIWIEADASILVPGDIIGIKMGGVVPADVRLLEGDPLEIDQSIITGECITVTKNPGEFVYSGSTCKRGEIEAVVYATGIHTYFGKVAHLEDNTNQVGRFQKVRTAVGYFCVCTVAIGMVAEMIVMYAVQKKRFRDGIGNLFVILIGGIPIAIPTVLSMTMAIGSHRLSELGAIVKRMTAIEEMACMDVLCSDNKGTLTLNKFSVDRDLVEVFAEGVDKDHVLLLAARASRTENQDAIDAAIVGMLSDPNQARAGIREVHFQSFNPVYKRTAITYIDHNDNWHCVTKGSPKQIVTLCNCKQDVKFRVHSLIKKFAEDGFLSLGVARQEIPEKAKDGLGGPWEFVGLLPLFDSPRPDSAASIRRAVDLGVIVKMITRDQLAIAKETGRRLGMGTNMYPSSSLLGSLPANGLAELIEKADGFTGVFPEHKYEIVNKLKERKHICGMVGDGVDDVPALKKADIGIAVIDATHAAKSASNVIFTEPGLRVIISAVLTSRSMVQTINNYFIYSVSKTIHMVLGFMLIASIWNFNFSPFMVLIIVILIEGSIVPISKDRVEPSPVPESCKLKEIVATGIVLGCYLAVTSVFFSWLMRYTAFFDPAVFRPLKHSEDEMMAALFLQISITSQALILFTRTRVNPVDDCPGLLLVSAVFFAQFVSTLIAVYADWGFAHVKGIGWLWAYIIWSYDGLVLIHLVWIKTKIQNFFSEEAAFTTKRDNHEDERETQGDLMDQRVSHELQPLEITPPFAEGELPEIVDQAGRQV